LTEWCLCDSLTARTLRQNWPSPLRFGCVSPLLSYTTQLCLSAAVPARTEPRLSDRATFAGWFFSHRLFQALHEDLQHPLRHNKEHDRISSHPPSRRSTASWTRSHLFRQRGTLLRVPQSTETFDLWAATRSLAKLSVLAFRVSGANFYLRPTSRTSRLLRRIPPSQYLIVLLNGLC